VAYHIAVNSITVRLPKVLAWLQARQPDILALQETKIVDEKFPITPFIEIGYHVIFSGEKTYNGVALLSRLPLTEIEATFPLPENFPQQKRFLSAKYKTIRLVNLYVPNGQAVDSEKFKYKTEWLLYLLNYLKEELKTGNPIVLLGDFNIAPDDLDVHEPLLWEDSVLFSKQIRQLFQELLALGFSDCFRLMHPTERAFSWWDYRNGAFWKNHGLRIDHILMSHHPHLSCQECIIDREARKNPLPSDHAPVMADFSWTE